jgi:hypothetical protein
MSVIRGSAINISASGSRSISLSGLNAPGGGSANALAGDLAVVFFGAFNPAIVSTGWTVIGTPQNNCVLGSGWWSKTLTSGDISTGTVSFTAFPFSNVLELVVFIGVPAVRESDYPGFSTGCLPSQIDTTSAVQPGDLCVIFTVARTPFGGVSTISPGTQIQTVTDPNTSGSINTQVGTSGVTLYTSSGGGQGGGMGVLVLVGGGGSVQPIMFAMM